MVRTQSVEVMLSVSIRKRYRQRMQHMTCFLNPQVGVNFQKGGTSFILLCCIKCKYDFGTCLCGHLADQDW